MFDFAKATKNDVFSYERSSDVLSDLRMAALMRISHVALLIFYVVVNVYLTRTDILRKEPWVLLDFTIIASLGAMVLAILYFIRIAYKALAKREPGFSTARMGTIIYLLGVIVAGTAAAVAGVTREWLAGRLPALLSDVEFMAYIASFALLLSQGAGYMAYVTSIPAILYAIRLGLDNYYLLILLTAQAAGFIAALAGYIFTDIIGYFKLHEYYRVGAFRTAAILNTLFILAISPLIAPFYLLKATRETKRTVVLESYGEDTQIYGMN